MIKQVFIFANGNIAVFDENGQVPAAQTFNWIDVVARHLEKFCKPDDENITYALPNGEMVKVVKTSNGYSVVSLKDFTDWKIMQEKYPVETSECFYCKAKSADCAYGNLKGSQLVSIPMTRDEARRIANGILEFLDRK